MSERNDLTTGTAPRIPDTAPDTDVPRLRAWVEDHRGAMLDDLARYVDTETPSNHKPSLDAGLDWLGTWLINALGTPAATRRTNGHEHGDIEVFDYPGQGSAPILLLCHYDTVWDLGTTKHRPFQVSGDRATGPGVFDMKAGLVQAVWALRALDAAGLPRPPVRLLLNGDEEIGSPASRPVIEAEADGATAALVFEPSTDGAVKTARKGVGIFHVHATGLEAHAGLDPDKGVSAVEEIARAVLSLHALTDPTTGTTVNVGVLNGGTRTNVTAGTATAQVDVRLARHTEAARIDAALAELRPHNPRATLTVSGGWNRPVMERTEPVAQLYQLAHTVAARMGVELRECSVGGASDGNFVAALGLPVLDGFGAVGDGAHAVHEHVSVNGMVERTVLAAAVLHALAD